MKVQQVLSYTGGPQTFSVPANVTSVRFELWGAGGSMLNISNGSGTSGYSGAVGAYSFSRPQTLGNVHHKLQLKSLVGYVAGTLAVTAGDVYTIYVGGAGGVSNSNPDAEQGTNNYGPGGYNGGGRGGYATPGAFGYGRGSFRGGGGGGGATDVRYGGTALSNRILVAGGGGGGGTAGNAGEDTVAEFTTAVPIPVTPSPPYFKGDQTGNTGNPSVGYRPSGGPTYGGAGGASVGYPGGEASQGSQDSVPGSYGRGGTNGAGGVGGSGSSGQRNAGAAGSLGQGGAGGDVTAALFTSSNNTALCGGGGGGGGYYGGGGGSSGCTTPTFTATGAGGGGGSNYVGPTFTQTASYGGCIPGGADINIPAWNGAARLTYQQLPDSPSMIVPSAADPYIDSAHDLALEWAFSSQAPGAVQAGFDIQYREIGGGTYTTVSLPTGGAAGTYTLPSGTFLNGHDYEIYVRTYDQQGDVGPWSNQIVAHAVAFPGAPTVSSPASGATVTEIITTDWTVDSGVTEWLYEIQVQDATGNVAVDSGQLAASRKNLVDDPSFENAAGISGGWFVSGGTLTQESTWAKYGSKSALIDWSYTAVETDNPAFTNAWDGFIAGNTYTASVWVTCDTPGSDPTVQLIIRGQTNDSIAASTVSDIETAGTFVRLSTTFIADGESMSLSVVPLDEASTGVTYVDCVLVEAGDQLLDYFDGGNPASLPGTASWTGSADRSASTLVIANVLSGSVTFPETSQPGVLLVRYSTLEADGVWSPWASVPVVINVDAPDVPAVILTKDNDAGTVTLEILDGASTYPATYVDVYRTNTSADEPEKRIAVNLVPASLAGVVHVSNGSFENDADNWVSNSTALTYPATSFAATDEESFDGLQSLKVITDGAHALEGASTSVTVPALTTVTFTAWVKAPTPIRLATRDTTNSVSGTTSASTGSNEWEPLSSTLTTGASPATVEVAVAVDGAVATTFYVDHVEPQRRVVYVDTTPATRTTYTYRVRAWSAAGGYSDAT